MESRTPPATSGQVEHPAKPGTALRCGCGNLLARVVSSGVELKCRRCKRQVIIPFDSKATIKLTL